MDDFYTMDRLKSIIESGYALIGRHTYGDVAINGNISKLLYIGKFCSIATGLTVFCGNEHSINRVTTYPFCAISRKEEVNMDWGAADISGHPCSKGDVHIANDVWIGAHVTILSGVTVGDGAVIGAHAVVANDVEPYSVVAGNPARFIKWRFPKDVREALLRIQWWEWSDEKIKKAVPLLCSDNIASFITQYESAENWL